MKKLIKMLKGNDPRKAVVPDQSLEENLPKLFSTNWKSDLFYNVGIC